jgi:hypothetical protein
MGFTFSVMIGSLVWVGKSNDSRRRAGKSPLYRHDEAARLKSTKIFKKFKNSFLLSPPRPVSRPPSHHG